MRRALLPLAVFLLAGCGGTLGAQEHRQRPAEGRTLSADGISVALPAGWSGRILLGDSGRPVLHAASFPLPAGDDDSGEIAKESMGRELYLNVRDLGPGDSQVAFPITFSASDFGAPPPGPGSMCCRITEASNEVAVSGELYRITAISGGQDPPGDALLEQANGVLMSLFLSPYVPDPIPPLPPDTKRIEGYGITMRLPSGWDGAVTRGKLEASTAGLRLRLRENGGTDAPYATARLPIRLSTAEFVGTPRGTDPKIVASTGRSFVDQGRNFVLDVEADSLPPSEELVTQANQALANLDVKPGDFYPGTVEPATFAPADGWYAGDGGRTNVRPDGQQTWTWASTVPYRDEAGQFPPRKTLENLPPDAIVIGVMLFGPDKNSSRKAQPPFRIAQADREYPWEGQVEDFPLYGIAGRVPGQQYNVDVFVLFGRNHPTDAQVAAADAELERLKLPDWSASD
ncbi:MAG TPA: hypothetical protein VF895_09320 [Gaiellaceae bacterium]